jgi:hypothetical protein
MRALFYVRGEGRTQALQSREVWVYFELFDLEALLWQQENNHLRPRDGPVLSVLPSTVNCTELSAAEFRDALLLRYAWSPPDLPSQCDGCLQKLIIRHALECKTGGLVILRHNKIRDKLSALASKALSPSVVCDEPTIHNSCTIARTKD